MHFERQHAFQIHNIIFSPEKNDCLPYLKFSDPLQEPHLFFNCPNNNDNKNNNDEKQIWGYAILDNWQNTEAMLFWIIDKIHVAEYLRNGKKTFLLLCFSWLFHAKKTLYSPR